MNTAVEKTVAATGKWTEELAKSAAEKYEAYGKTPEAVKKIAKEMGRTSRSVQGKLTTMGLYVTPEKKAKAKKDDGPTKGEIQTAIKNLGFSPDGFEAATKPALLRLQKYLEDNARVSE